MPTVMKLQDGAKEFSESVFAALTTVQIGRNQRLNIWAGLIIYILYFDLQVQIAFPKELKRFLKRKTNNMLF